MKTKVVLTSFALAAATGSLFVACNNEDFVTENGAIEQSGMIELSENFMISAAGVDNASTRTHWELNQNGGLTNAYIPVVAVGTGNNTLGGSSVIAPSIGLCWIGTAGAGEQVYTNYEFFHNGWLAKGETAKFDPCDDSKLTNGWLYSDLKFATAASSTNPGEEVFNEVSDLVQASGITSKTDAEGNTLIVEDDLDLNSGVYKTCNKAIFGGQYIAYYPYNADFKDAGAIPATSVVEFNEMKKNDATDLQLSDNTFRYTNVATINGGTQAEGFGFKNLSGVVRVVLKSADNADLTQKIKTVMLYSPSSAFVKEVLLSPAKIAAGAAGTDLYSKVTATNKTIVVNMATSELLTVTKEGKDESKVYLTALPAKISDLTVMVQAEDDTWAECEIGDFEIAAGQGKELVATYSAKDFKSVYYAVDQTTLNAAITKCSAAGLSATKKATIKVLGDITLTASTIIPSWVTIEGDKLIVPEDKTLTLNNNSAIKSDVIVEGKSCCSGTKGGILSVAGATIDGNVTITAGEATPAKAGSIEFTAAGAIIGETVAIETEGSVKFADDSNVAIFGTLTLAEGVEATVAEKAVVAVKGGTINNSGTFEVLGDFSMLDAQGSTVAAAGKNFKNNGTFIDNVGSKVGGATQYMTFGENGDYICKVDGVQRMNEAYENKTACSTIEIISTVDTYYTFEKVRQHNEKDVDIVVTGNNIHFVPKEAITIGNLTIVGPKNEVFIDETNEVKDADSNPIGWATIKVNGDIVAGGVFYCENDVRNMEANNLLVVKGGKVKFKNREDSQDKTLTVNETIEVQKGGRFEIAEATGNNNIAYVTCTKLVEGGTFVGKPIVVE